MSLRKKAWNQDNVSKWRDMPTDGLLFQRAKHYKNPTKHIGPSLSSHRNIACSRHNIIVYLALNNNHSLIHSFILKILASVKEIPLRINLFCNIQVEQNQTFQSEF